MKNTYNVKKIFGENTFYLNDRVEVKNLSEGAKLYGGATEINNEYEKAMEQARINETRKAKTKKEEDFIKSQFMNSKGFREKIDKLIKLDNIVIEICGTWLYISGKGTYNHKEYLKNEFGAFWSKSKKCWCISPQGKEFKKSRGYKGKTLNDIRNTYGSEKIKSKGTILIEGK